MNPNIFLPHVTGHRAHARLATFTALAAIVVLSSACYVTAPAGPPGQPTHAAAREPGEPTHATSTAPGNVPARGSAGGGSCFMTYDGPTRQFCEAYREGKSCFMAFRNRSDQGWCEHLKERKSCFMALSGAERKECEAGRLPRDHEIWVNGGPR